MSRTELLDHGYLETIDTWGSDERIIESARMSTDGAFRGWGRHCSNKRCDYPMVGRVETACPLCGSKVVDGDEKLLRYLWEHKHATPFEMCGATIEVQAPIFVFRQWHRHRTQSYNELSARYTPLPDECFVPTVDRCIVVAGKNKQARGASGRTPTHDEVLHWVKRLKIANQWCREAYDYGLQVGIPKELARLSTTVGNYTRMRASANLRNWLAFMTLRSDTHAQEEIRVYSDAIGRELAKAFPRTMELFAESMDARFVEYALKRDAQ